MSQTGENSISDIKKYLEVEGMPIQNNEFMEFWKSLSDEEKLEFKNTELK